MRISASTVTQARIIGITADCSMLTRLRIRGGRTFSNLVRARTEVSSMPVIVPPAAVSSPWRLPRLIIIEEQRWDVGPGFQFVATGRSRGGADPVAQFAQPFDVTAEGPLAHLETVDQLLTAPGASAWRSDRSWRALVVVAAISLRILPIPVRNGMNSR